MKLETVEAFHLMVKSHDCGSKLGYMKANVEYRLHHTDLSADFPLFRGVLPRLAWEKLTR